MADKRMFSLKIVDSDLFLDMPLSSQCLYFHLSMRADDDGFVDNPKKIIKIIGANEDDLKSLITKGFVIVFERGIIVITHWKINNYISNDRRKEPMYITEKQSLTQTENRAYIKLENLGIPNDNQVSTICPHSIHENKNKQNTGTKTIKKIGKAIYEVVVHLNKNATETMQDKLKRIIIRKMEREKHQKMIKND